MTVAQLGLAYIMRLSPVVIPLQGSSDPERIVSNVGAVNVQLGEEEVEQIDAILASFEIAGDRYPIYAQAALMN